jgi:hypothetical protein
MRKHSTVDINRNSPERHTGLPGGDPIPPQHPDTVMPTKVAAMGEGGKTNQPSTTFPDGRMAPEANSGAAAQPVVPGATAGMPSARATAPAAPAPRAPSATPGMDYNALRSLSAKYSMGRR